MMERRALFVGVNNYSDRDIHPLRFAVEDATDLAGFFKHCAKFNRAEVLTDPRNCDAVLDRVHDMLYGLGPGDEFLFFFAGHGVTTHDGHRLVCSSDKLSAVKHAWAGLPLERLKLETAGPFNRLFLLDACRSDVLATNRGASCAMEIGTRDLIMAGASSADEKDGVLTILCSCDDNECAGESAVLRHGLFSKAMLEMLDEEHRDGRIVLVDDDFVYRRLPERMRLLAQESGMDFSQKPQKRGPAILLLDGIASPSRVQGVSPSVSSPACVECPACGKCNLITETFRCKVCGKEHLCLSHFSAEYNCCDECMRLAQARRQEEPQIRKSKVQTQIGNTPEMMYKKGMAYLKGDGVIKDEKEAFRCFVSAANSGIVKAMEELAECYYYGRGTYKDYELSVKWYLKAVADSGCSAYSQYCIGFMYEHGQGVTQSSAEAERWYRKASDRGNVNAKEALLKKKTIRVEVSEHLGGVQLWKDGPFWAECNVGATRPEEHGYYFCWGNTVGYKRNANNDGWISVNNGEKFTFSEENSSTCLKGNVMLRLRGYIGLTGNLVSAHDAAAVHLGSPWRMPTLAEVEALVKNCTSEWIRGNGAPGILVSGKGNFASRSIFLPAAGEAADSNLREVGLSGGYWSSTPSSCSGSRWAHCLKCDSWDFTSQYGKHRSLGLSVRPVRGFA